MELLTVALDPHREHLPRHAGRVEGIEGLGGRQARGTAQAIDAALAT